jgi:hypothetical protein
MRLTPDPDRRLAALFVAIVVAYGTVTGVVYLLRPTLGWAILTGFLAFGAGAVTFLILARDRRSPR